MVEDFKADKKIFKSTIGGRELIVETGAYCGLSNGSCLVRCGDTVVLTNVTMADAPRAGIDFFPLGVDFEEKMYAVGKIPGGFKKREGRASDKAILVSRLIDRPIRPLFPKGFFNDVAVVCTALSVDTEIPPEVYAMIGSSIALSISDIPFMGPTGSVVVGYVDGKYVINPNSAQREKSRLSLSLSGTKDAIMMVEAGSTMISEDEMLAAIMFGHEEIKRVVAFIEEIQKAVGKAKSAVPMYVISDEFKAEVKAYANDKMNFVLDTFDRVTRETREKAAGKEVQEYFAAKYPTVNYTREVTDVLYSMKKEKVRARILNDGIRPDGRTTTEVRPIWCEVGVLPRVHGSAVFTRGLTQALTTCTLGTITEVQKLEGIDDDIFKRYMHHYNMPPYSTAEAKPLRSPGRREIGHGALAERALEPVLPTERDFPYAIRTVSEILSSNGSTSQASVCGSTMSLMNAGVPISAPVAGIAMGLIKNEETNQLAVLTDIQGLEDFLGDMDFKVAGTADGITAIQMDIKIKGIDEAIMKTALAQAKVGRLHILSKMMACISKPSETLSQYAPKIVRFNIDPDKIRDVIGSGGKVINKIITDTGVKIDINDNGEVLIATCDSEMSAKAKAIIMSIVHDPEVGDEFVGNVFRIEAYGCFVNIGPGRDGLVHISKLAKERVEKVEDVVKMNEMIKVKVIKIDEKGRVDLQLVSKM